MSRGQLRGETRRFLWAGMVLVVAGLAALGNAPAPGMRVVRRSISGPAAPEVKAHHALLKVTLAPGRYKALAFWELGRDQPALILQARLPEVRALPLTVTLGRRIPELKTQARFFQVTVRKGSLGRVVDYGQQVGWFGVQLWDLQGRVSALFFEGAREAPRGYLRCGKGKVVRDQMARGMDPEEVKHRFLVKFKSFQLPTVLPPEAPPGKRSSSSPPSAAPPRRK